VVRHARLGGGAVAASAVTIAQAKVAVGVTEAFFRGVLCNVLVCLAVWLCFAAHDVPGKVLAIIFPISAFVASASSTRSPTCI
jgi:formate/nitrite transporter FocA (FNT family)